MLFDRRLGMEQEFFIVDPEGESANRADELVELCQSIAEENDLDSSCFEREWVKNILEIATPPCSTIDEVASSYATILKTAISAANELDLRLYPLSVYPLHLIPSIRDEVRYHVQIRTIGHERFLHAGRCAGAHLHLEVPAGTIDDKCAVSFNATPESREELLNVYNLTTAIDPALIALSRACPYFEGMSCGLAHRTVRYRGGKNYGWEGVYTDLPEVGALRPYANSVEHLVQLQFERHHAWLNAMDKSSVERDLFFRSGASLLSSSWNPVRLNRHGTIELRSVDGNFPQVILSLFVLIRFAHRRVVQEQIQVQPKSGARTFEESQGKLMVPNFDYLNRHLLFAAVTEGLRSSSVWDFTQSVFEFACGGSSLDSGWSDRMRPMPVDTELRDFQTTESHLLKQFPSSGERLSRQEGLEIVRYACDELESQVQKLEDMTAVEEDEPCYAMGHHGTNSQPVQ